MSALSAVIAFLGGTVVVGVIVHLLARQAEGELRKVGDSLAERAAAQLPEEHRARWLAEWQADLDEKYATGPFSGIAYALKIARDAPKLACELAPVAETAGGRTATISRKATTRSTRTDLGRPLKRLTALVRSVARSTTWQLRRIAAGLSDPSAAARGMRHNLLSTRNLAGAGTSLAAGAALAQFVMSTGIPMIVLAVLVPIGAIPIAWVMSRRR